MFVFGGSVLCLGAPTPPPSTGFPDPGYIMPIEEFRLPAWGYQTLKLGLHFSGRGQTTEISGTAETSEGNLSFSPAFGKYHESEKNVTRFSLRVDGHWRVAGVTLSLPVPRIPVYEN